MESYEEVLIQYEPLIKGLIKRFNYIDGYDELFQIGRIALWEAYKGFDSEKGSFPAYAKSYVTGRFLHHSKKPPIETFEITEFTSLNELQYEVPFLETFILEELTCTLSPREKLFVEFVLIQRGKQKSLADQEAVSYETVRTWRKSALKKLRALVLQ